MVVNMEVNILEKSKNVLKFEIKGDKHTVTNLLREKLFEDSEVSMAGYDKTHPLEDNAISILKTNSKDATSVLKNAISSLEKELDNLKKELSNVK